MHTNMINSNKLSLIISLLIHLLILLIPISIMVSPMISKEIELFVINEEKTQVQKRQKIERKKVEKQEKFVEEKIVEEKIIEPAIPAESPQVVVSAPSPALSPPQVHVESKAEVKDVEFGSAEGPKFLHREMPVYPLLARRLGKEGRVLLRLTIDERGRLLNIEVIEGARYGFTESAVDAVRKSSFLPAKKEGIPIASRALLPIKFTLRGSE